MNTSTGRTVSELSTENAALPKDLQTTSQPTAVSHCDTSVQSQAPRAVSQQTIMSCCDNYILASNTSSANIQTRGNAGIDGPINSAVTKNSKPISGQDIVIHVAASKVLHEKQFTTEEILCEEAAESEACPSSPARSALEGLSCRDDDAAASPQSTRLFSDSENESPRSARLRRNVVSRSLDSIRTPRAPMKPARVRSLNTLFPGKTRRRLDFDHL